VDVVQMFGKRQKNVHINNLTPGEQIFRTGAFGTPFLQHHALFVGKYRLRMHRPEDPSMLRSLDRTIDSAIGGAMDYLLTVTGPGSERSYQEVREAEVLIEAEKLQTFRDELDALKLFAHDEKYGKLHLEKVGTTTDSVVETFGTLGNISVRMITLHEFRLRCECFVQRSPSDTPIRRSRAVKKALLVVGEEYAYRILSANCESLVRWCKFHARSYELFLKRGGYSAQGHLVKCVVSI